MELWDWECLEWSEESQNQGIFPWNSWIRKQGKHGLAPPGKAHPRKAHPGKAAESGGKNPSAQNGLGIPKKTLPGTTIPRRNSRSGRFPEIPVWEGPGALHEAVSNPKGMETFPACGSAGLGSELELVLAHN